MAERRGFRCADGPYLDAAGRLTASGCTCITEGGASVRTKEQIYADAVNEAVRRFGGDGLDEAGAVARYLDTPEGERRFHEYQAAPASPAARSTQAPTDWPLSGEVLRRAFEEAERLKRPGESREQAMSRLMSERPELYRTYERARAADIEVASRRS